MTTSCPTCGSNRSHPLLALEQVPVLCNRLYEDAEDAAGADHAAIELYVCGTCATTWNAVFEPARLAYEPGYENSLYGSPTFRRYSDRLVRRLTDTYDLQGAFVVELGCGDARFLVDLCKHAGARGAGVDPSYQGPAEPAPDVTVHRTESIHPDRPPRLIVFRHVLEHVADPVAFLREARAMAGPATAIYCEVPDASTMFADSGVWDVIYEHPLYFTRASVTTALHRAGLEVTRAVSDYDGQFLCVDAAPGRPGDDPEAAADVAAARAFGRRAGDAIRTWQTRLSTWMDEGRRVALWGMGSKGTTFLSLVPAAGGLSHLVDVNPAKQGRHPPGSTTPISAPADLRDGPPDTVIVANPAYLGEIAASLESLGVPARCLPLWEPSRDT